MWNNPTLQHIGVCWLARRLVYQPQLHDFCTSFVCHYSPSQTFQSASLAVSSFFKIRGLMWPWYHCDWGVWVDHIQLQGLNNRLWCLPIHLTHLSVSQEHWMHMVSKLISICRGSNLRPCGPKPDKWWCYLSHHHKLLHKTYGVFMTNNQVQRVDWSPLEVNWQAQLKDWRGASMQAQRFIKHDTAKYEILLVYCTYMNK